MTRAKMSRKLKTQTTKAASQTVVLFVFIFIFIFASSIWVVSSGFIAAAQDKPPAQNSDQASTEKAKTEKPVEPQPNQAAPTEHQPTSIAGELAKETRVAEGEEQEEHSDLKHSSMVQKLAKMTGMSVHGAHLFALILNFAVRS